MLKLAIERLTDILSEVEELWRSHFQEVVPQQAASYNPDREGFLALERAGRLRLFTARIDGRLIGQLGFIVHRSRHTQLWVAEEEFLFVRREDRGGGIADELVRFGLLELRDEGIEEVRFSDKQPSDLEPFLKKFGFKFVSKQYSLVFREV